MVVAIFMIVDLSPGVVISKANFCSAQSGLEKIMKISIAWPSIPAK
jgi:hypothetical protein